MLRSFWFHFSIGLFGVAPLAYAQNAAGSKPFNPDISANLLGKYRQETNAGNDRTAGLHDGFSIDESEFQLAADVDTYFRAAALFSVEQEDGTKDFGIDPEEVYFETLSLPAVTLKAGKFKAALGKHNQLHAHAFPFIDPPLINVDLLGGEGLNDVGAAAAVLIPTPWFMEFTLQVLATNNDILYDSPHASDVAPVAYLKNLWDLNDDTTMEVGAYGTVGKNVSNATSVAYGGDLIFKWRPAEGGKYKALIWQTEYLGALIRDAPEGQRLGGIASWLQYQFARRWWVQARGEYEGIPHSQGRQTKQRESALLAFFPSEFSGFRLQYDYLDASLEPTHHAVTLQYDISIGAHPAHAY